MLFTALLLAGCSVMGDKPVEGWPQLQIVEHYVPTPQMRDRCSRYVGFGMMPEACSEFDLAGRKCHIWFSDDPMPAGFIRKHERLHCQGYDQLTSVQASVAAHSVSYAIPRLDTEDFR